jgi:hypothetical protein
MICLQKGIAGSREIAEQKQTNKICITCGPVNVTLDEGTEEKKNRQK